jgi:predicted RNase H-like nuclease (RuvC/YqgF family)
MTTASTMERRIADLEHGVAALAARITTGRLVLDEDAADATDAAEDAQGTAQGLIEENRRLRGEVTRQKDEQVRLILRCQALERVADDRAELKREIIRLTETVQRIQKEREMSEVDLVLAPWVEVYERRHETLWRLLEELKTLRAPAAALTPAP